MEALLITFAVIMALVGVLGAVVPMLPGPPLSFVGLLLMWFCEGSGVSPTMLWVSGILMVVITILDYVAPIWLTNVGGGSKQGTYGATIGMFLGLFFLPWGIVVGPFLGALIGELMAHTATDKALKVALMSFLAFMLTTGVKLIYSVVLIVIIIKEVIGMFF